MTSCMWCDKYLGAIDQNRDHSFNCGIGFDETTAIVTAKRFERLPDYSASLPTGTAIGKRWKRRVDYDDPSQGWFLGEYVPCDEPGRVGIHWRRLYVARSPGDPDRDVTDDEFEQIRARFLAGGDSQAGVVASIQSGLAGFEDELDR